MERIISKCENRMVRTVQTNRYYSKHGQRISWTTHLSGIVFVDHDRNVYGYLEDCAPDFDAILDKYDRGEYVWDKDSAVIIDTIRRCANNGDIPLNCDALKI